MTDEQSYASPSGHDHDQVFLLSDYQAHDSPRNLENGICEASQRLDEKLMLRCIQGTGVLPWKCALAIERQY